MVKNNNFSERQLYALDFLQNSLDRSCDTLIQCYKSELNYCKRIESIIKETSEPLKRYQALLNRLIDEELERKRNAKEKINCIADETLRKILYMRYAEHKTVIAVSLNIGYSDRQIARLHHNALDALADVLGFTA